MKQSEVRYVIIERAEGLTIECNRPQVFGGWGPVTWATTELNRWRHSAPKAGFGYHKCDVTFVSRSGEVLAIREDLQADTVVQLSDHLEDEAE